jgi:ribonuclease BN (tRNA processing enzyme)
MMGGPVRVTIFGSAAGFPTEKRLNTAIGIWRGEELYLIDSGEPTAAYLARRGVSREALRAVFITHPHVDHVGGLPMLLQWHQLNHRTRRLLICLPKEMIVPLREFADALYLLPDLLGFDLELRPVAPGPVYRADGVSVEAIANRHVERLAEHARSAGYPALGDSFSYRVTVDSRKLFFSGDLARAEEAVPHVGGVDLAVVELAHFTPEQLGEALSAVALPRLVVTHLIHTLEPVEEGIPDRIKAAGFGGEVIVAGDGTEVEL